MKLLFCLFHLVVLGGFLGMKAASGAGGAPPAPSPTSAIQANAAKVSPPAIPTGSEARLPVRVSVTSVGQPLSVVLQTLSAASGVALKTPSYVGVQRMTLCLKNKPLHEVMRRIVETLSHQVNGPNHYFWDATNDSGVLVYTLRPAASAAAAFRANLAEPRQEAIQSLTDERTIAQLPPNERSNYKSKQPAGVYARVDTSGHAQALKALSNSQFAVFLKTGVATVRADKIRAALETDYKAAQKNSLIAPGYIKVTSETYTPPVDQITLRFFSVGEREFDQFTYADPIRADLYGYQLGGIEKPYFFVYLNGYREEETGVGLLDETPKPDAKPLVYDLTPFFAENAAPFSQRVSMGYALSALAKTTGATVYEEHFLRAGPVGMFGVQVTNTNPPRVLKGTLPQLVNSICRNWGYRVTQAENGDLVFWSRRWGRDKQADIAESTLAPWRRTLKERGYFTELDYRDMVTKLSYAQIRTTLPFAFPFSDDEAIHAFADNWQHHKYMARRIDTLLTPNEREAALSPEGIRLADVTARQTILREVRFRSDAQIEAFKTGADAPPPTEQQILHSRIFLPKIDWKTVPQPELAVQRFGGLLYDPLRLIIKSDAGLHWQ